MALPIDRTSAVATGLHAGRIAHGGDIGSRVRRLQLRHRSVTGVAGFVLAHLSVEVFAKCSERELCRGSISATESSGQVSSVYQLVEGDSVSGCIREVVGGQTMLRRTVGTLEVGGGPRVWLGMGEAWIHGQVQGS